MKAFHAVDMCEGDHGRMAFSASPSDHTAAPSSTTSFSRNCPGTTDRLGKPPRLGSHPGVENRKLSVVRNIITAMPLPRAATRAETGRNPNHGRDRDLDAPEEIRAPLDAQEAVRPPHEGAVGHQPP